MWTWDQSAGTMTRAKVIYHGYAGHDLGRNNPRMQAARAIGPIPRGLWRMTAVKDSLNTGPFSVILEPFPGTDCRGRSDFRIQGDSIAHPGTASHGCIILSRTAREAIWRSDDHVLEVIA